MTPADDDRIFPQLLKVKICLRLLTSKEESSAQWELQQIFLIQLRNWKKQCQWSHAQLVTQQVIRGSGPTWVRFFSLNNNNNKKQKEKSIGIKEMSAVQRHFLLGTAVMNMTSPRLKLSQGKISFQVKIGFLRKGTGLQRSGLSGQAACILSPKVFKNRWDKPVENDLVINDSR